MRSNRAMYVISAHSLMIQNDYIYAIRYSCSSKAIFTLKNFCSIQNESFASQGAQMYATDLIDLK